MRSQTTHTIIIITHKLMIRKLWRGLTASPVLIIAVFFIFAPIKTDASLASKILSSTSIDDIASAGLSLPGKFMESADCSHPISILSDSQISYKNFYANLYGQDGKQPLDINESSSEFVISKSMSDKKNKFGIALQLGHNSWDVCESGENKTQFNVSDSTQGVGFAFGNKRLKIGLSNEINNRNASLYSSRLSSISSDSGMKNGFLLWNGNSIKNIVEVDYQVKNMSFGFLYGAAGGFLNTNTIISEQPYSAPFNLNSKVINHYISWKKADRDLLFSFSKTSSDNFAPVLLGNILVGDIREWEKMESYSIASIYESSRCKRIQSIEYSAMNSSLKGKAGGFWIPGILEKMHFTDNNLRLNKLVLRDGIDIKRGKFVKSFSCAFGYSKINYSISAEKADLFSGLKILADESLNNASMFFITPTIGLKYSSDEWILQFELGANAAYLKKDVSLDNAGSSKPGNSESSMSSKTQPSWQTGISITRQW